MLPYLMIQGEARIIMLERLTHEIREVASQDEIDYGSGSHCNLV